MNINCLNNKRDRENKNIKLTIDNLENNIFINGMNSQNLNNENINNQIIGNKLNTGIDPSMLLNSNTNQTINNFNSNPPNLSKFKLK